MVRYVRVASISFKGAGRRESIEDTVNANVIEMERLLDKALLDKPDIICFPEIAPTIGLNVRESIIIAYEMGDNILEKFREKAAKNNVYIVLPMIIINDGYPYNASILIGRDGNIVGSYYKVHPTINEIESGIVPGDKYNVFDTEFGK
ncbi:MAG TPA: carbon-nitrogen hydrolase family protein [Thermoprotei archaeon]|nr:carbon-nitrogen hydrolase family protein [Thermoprotei archaeon]